MTGFDPTWLALREPADERSRSQRLITLAAELLLELQAPRVCDLGAGTGSMARACAPHFPDSAKWLLVDGDAACLEIARSTAGLVMETRALDLSAVPDPWPQDTALVTASALFDLASAEWIESFVGSLARDRLALLSCLTFDGRIVFDPPDPDDDRIRTAFLLHQAGEKGLGGAACGPRAGAILSDALQRHGYDVETQGTPWKLDGGTNQPLMAALIDGYAQAAAETETVDHRNAQVWAARRKATVKTLLVGHTDLFATPKL